MIVELSEAAPVERPPFETDEATEGIEDEVGIVEEAVEDGNRSPDSIIVINVVSLVTSLLRNLYFRTESCGGWDFCLPQMVEGYDFCFWKPQHLLIPIIFARKVQSWSGGEICDRESP